jgi:hypothetical protein
MVSFQEKLEEEDLLRGMLSRKIAAESPRLFRHSNHLWIESDVTTACINVPTSVDTFADNFASNC